MEQPVALAAAAPVDLNDLVKHLSTSLTDEIKLYAKRRPLLLGRLGLGRFVPFGCCRQFENVGIRKQEE